MPWLFRKTTQLSCIRMRELQVQAPHRSKELEQVRSRMPYVLDDEQAGRATAISYRSSLQEPHRSLELELVRSKERELAQHHSKELERVRSRKEHRCNGCAVGCASEPTSLLAWFRHSRKELVRNKEPELARSRMLRRCNGCAYLHADELANQLAWSRRSMMEREHKLELVLVRNKLELDCNNRSCD